MELINISMYLSFITHYLLLQQSSEAVPTTTEQQTAFMVDTKDLSISSLHSAASVFYKEEKYESSLQFFLKAAEKDDKDAQLMVGNMFKEGKGTEKNCREAESWYKKAAEKGSTDAKVCIAKMYEEGSDNVRPDYDESRRWYLDAAEDNNKEAALCLGKIYEDGIGTKKDPARAYSWYERAASLGSAKEEFRGGRLYHQGTGNEAKNHNEFLKNSRVHCDNKDRIMQSYRLAFRYCKRSNAHGYPWAKYYLGICYQHSLGTKENFDIYDLALKYYNVKKPKSEEQKDVNKG